jgi:hypothetical protein
MWISLDLLGYAAAGAAFGALQRTRSQPYFEVLTSAVAAMRIEAVVCWGLVARAAYRREMLKPALPFPCG